MSWIHEYPPCLVSTDIPATRAFYQTHFGAEVILDLGWYLRISVPGCLQALCFITPLNGAPHGNRRGLTFPVEVADAGRVFRTLRERGETIAAPLRDHPWGDRAFFLQDPNGVLLYIWSEGTIPAAVLECIRRYS
jgi:uncharacterized glyoxalase superfamily protein PhnB